MDDNNGDAELNNQLAASPKVRLVVNKVREGLIRSKNIGAAMAGSMEGSSGQAQTSPVLVFLEAHIVVNQCWLEPLLQQLLRNPHSAALPVVDVLDDEPP